MKTSSSQSAAKVKILYVITQGELGGAQRYVLDLTTNLDKTRYETLVAVGRENPALKNSLATLGVKTAELDFLKRNISPLFDLLAVFELKELIRDFAPDIIHLNSSKAGVIGSVAAHLARNRNVVFTAHGFAFLEPHLFKRIYFWAEKFATRFRKQIITVSEFDRQEAIKWKLCASEKLVTIHNGLLVIPASEPESRKWILNQVQDDKTIVIGTIARDYPTKDLKTLRRAFTILQSEFPKTELKIISGPNAAQSLSEFDIYVSSSVKEGFPYSILEAMAAGLPIVSTAVGGIPEAVEHGKQGLLVPPKNPRALAAAIKKLIANPDLARQLGSGAQNKVQEFSLDKMLAETEAVYEMLANTSCPR
ncbi:MAG: hypothetical protein A3C85_03835 [Candidatus Doudnabacteria bacterium RIFCSPHIGHO2_02_FULL_48_21]|uniref:Glycosyl transferase family 1 n=1 Tax=Candidatus Doudnabacteria bacterium RIFCSPLOWO2_02_FULL_48_13 TaxID=1817845 RepID=A0A1F5QBU5_9BACT|nr:MAG: hypothetical protein A3K05_03330 [Candidatus Doudnabacteria bacterium RIFCSPHIGHO2_01_48_18]OGE77168.1 MAG: hypothetical protein A2668_01650 [Candidatus Doudnabacteria bacterium RIFCSPHIGHO2_01_FULL_48_180]OGE91773.1 MAG: hypothetical protein A3F44_00175 [Candidatus Doudnabacteria bacterium RIFCSPHIGHO2_12_FULL_47_25]OGE93586.1 MAG: hypothetical protein A3C85_03835 [Candidatus Doudnabacteria bacterium RIFCSPHIGHO2_02_FULL_48_21]OGE96516.1 MAG: hypothetical protein A3A83_04285 [Candidatu